MAASYAQRNTSDFATKIPLLFVWGGSNPKEFSAPRAGKEGKEAQQAILNFKGPTEPVLPKIDFHAYDQPQHLQGRIDSLVHGITVNLPEEYDHYGYEIRRYMTSIGNMEIYKNRYAIEDQLVNVQKARVIFEYWRDKLVAELGALEKEMKANPNLSAKIRTSFDVNSQIVTKFIIEMQSWVRANERLLTFLADNKKNFSFERGEFIFKSASDLKEFVALFQVRERAKNQLRKSYSSFIKIVY